MATTTISGRPTFGGLASGLDTNALLEGLLAIERQPLERMETRRAEVDNQRSLVRQLNTKLLALRDASRALDNRNTNLSNASTSEEFLKYQGSSTNEEVVEVTAGKGASAGDIQIRVEQLARGSRRFSTPFTVAAGETTDDAIALQAGQSVTIALPNGRPNDVPVVEPTSITISAGAETLSLSDLRDRINGSVDNAGHVRADILQSSEGTFQLILTSTGTGTENELQVTGDLAVQAVNVDGSDSAQNAVFHLFGQRIERQSNVADDVLTGVSLKLKGVAELDDNDQPITETVTVSVDTDAIAASLQGFVDAYNDAAAFLDSQAKYNETTKTAGPLSGDSILRDVQRRLREVVSKAYRFEENPNNPFALGVDPDGRTLPGGSVSGIGIEIIGNGRLKLNRERLDEVLAQDPLAVKEFMSGHEIDHVENQQQIDEANAWNDSLPPGAPASQRRRVPEEDRWDAGFFTNVGEQLEEIVRTGDGLLSERDKLFASRLKVFDSSIDRFNSRLALREETLVQRFSALERIVSGLQNQQGFLSSLR